MNIYKTSVNNPVTTIILFVAIMVFGGISLSRLGIDLFPDIESNAMMVMTTYPGASDLGIRRTVTSTRSSRLINEPAILVKNGKRIM